MDNRSQETLRRIERNDAQFMNRLQLGIFRGWFISSNSSDYSRLGAAIGNNTHLTKLVVNPVQTPALNIANTEFFNGIKRNSSINDLVLSCNHHILIGGVEHEILKSYQKINNNLTCLCINRAVLDNGGDRVIADTLRWCRNIKNITLPNNNITDEQLLPMIDTIKTGCDTSLEHLYLQSNRIGNAGCHALATLLEDPHCSLQTLSLNGNQIGTEGATAIANSLANNNTKLKQLCLRNNPFDPSAVGIFCTVLCNTSSVNDTYHSNHTLEELVLPYEQQRQHANLLSSLRRLNNGTNKSHVAISKILKYHPNIDMGPLFEWDEEGEQTLKALPFVIDWFERAEEATAYSLDDEDRYESGEEGYNYQIEEKKLSAIFQFAKAMPVLFVPASDNKEESKKRKRVCSSRD